ncbi:hypothetical protein Ae717Ps2_1521c [Pseudonocardia sp. Ae717_Ps2]|uniref:hypothetical protein n=1 Tax=unclassified Pseudonocardia TaxID=2619320 RepID=UPI0009626F1E|nr:MULTISPECIES: hypothetical protein [unclassified Pseudonocardia]OLM30626.1 hypothetical protein Ae717Ps2_1521c [Pseudonocardia sp. Ae717_Ps2]
MPPHRDWTRRGAGRALLYWPLTAFLLVAAFPAYSVVLVIASGILLPTLGLVAGLAGKRWRARKLARARRALSDVVDTTPSAEDGSVAHEDGSGGTGPGAAWPTGRHARRAREQAAPAAEEPAARDAA